MSRPESPQSIRASHDGLVHDASVAWSRDGWTWTVVVTLPGATGPREVRASADDAFEALSRVREQLDPEGWRLGVAGAQRLVWPSGMARDQGSGLVAYRLDALADGQADGQAESLVATFEPVDPASVTTYADQRAASMRHLGWE